MKISPLVWLLIGIILLGGGYFAILRPSISQPTTLNSTSSLATELVIPLESQNNLGQSGSARITENAQGKAVVSLTLTGGDFSEPQPAHIHVGACPIPGAIKYPLTSVENGTSQTTLPIGLAELQLSADKMAINVHKSAAEASVYSACGDLVSMSNATNGSTPSSPATGIRY